MPIFEFICEECKERFEKLMFSSSEPPHCPACDSPEVRKVPSVFGFSSGGKTVTSSSSGCAGCTSTNCSNCK